jgi:hypothetical protein
MRKEAHQFTASLALHPEHIALSLSSSCVGGTKLMKEENFHLFNTI